MRQWDPATSAGETNVDNLKDQYNRFPVPWAVRESLFFVFGKFRNLFPIFPLDFYLVSFSFFYTNERQEFVDYSRDLGIPNLIRKMVMVKWIIGSFFSII